MLLTWIRIQGWTELVARPISVQSVLSRTTQQSFTLIQVSWLSIRMVVNQKECHGFESGSKLETNNNEKCRLILTRMFFFNSETFKDFDKKMVFDKFMAPIFSGPISVEKMKKDIRSYSRFFALKCRFGFGQKMKSVSVKKRPWGRHQYFI